MTQQRRLNGPRLVLMRVSRTDLHLKLLEFGLNYTRTKGTGSEQVLLLIYPAHKGPVLLVYQPDSAEPSAGSEPCR